MGSISAGIKGAAAGGALIAATLIVGCGSSSDARSTQTDTDAAASATAAAIPLAPATDAPTAATPVPETAAQSVGAELCTPDEKPYFACRIGAKRVAVCGNGTQAVYRYGVAGKVEMTARTLSYATRGYSGGGESQITATNGDTSYTVYDRTVRTGFGAGGNEPEFDSGLVVRRAGKTVSSRPCADEASVATAARQSIPEGSFVEH